MALGLLCTSCTDHQELPDPDRFEQTDFVSGLTAPVAIANGAAGTLWIAEMGSGKGSDGKVSLVTPDGNKSLVAGGFLSDLQSTQVEY